MNLHYTIFRRSEFPISKIRVGKYEFDSSFVIDGESCMNMRIAKAGERTQRLAWEVFKKLFPFRWFNFEIASLYKRIREIKALCISYFIKGKEIFVNGTPQRG